MPAKLGLPAMVIACLLIVATPVLAQTPAPDTTGAETSVPTTTIQSEPLTSEPGAITGPASTPGALPTRGPQVQLTPPPPSPFDPPVDGGSGRRVVYSKSQQTVWAYDENNTIIKVHRVSGRQDPGDPLPGTYQVWSRSIRTFSINNPTITWNYMVRFAKGDRGGNIGFHDIPYQYGQPVQTLDQLGQALSGGCVRQAPEDAIWMWNWAQIGTVVVVTP
ncbi:MAG TPA: L,D-transpeptidase [Ilumatobacteraceae bacterium]|nr:L,D-transpeptidase [Ilumatobacteraceae bacterium]